MGFLEYRDLLSNDKGVHELGRDIPPRSFDAFGRKAEGERREGFMAIDDMDLHVLRPHAAIGRYRHRERLPGAAEGRQSA